MLILHKLWIDSIVLFHLWFPVTPLFVVLILVPKVLTIYKMFFFLLDKMKLARAQFSMFNLELLQSLCPNIYEFVMLILKLGFEIMKYES